MARPPKTSHTGVPDQQHLHRMLIRCRLWHSNQTVSTTARLVEIRALLTKLSSRVAYLLSGESCIIGMKMYSLMPMLGVEVAAQLYLTIRFLLPLLCVHRDGSGLLVPLRKVVVRSSVGCATTMLVDVAVKVSLTLFNGEPVWLCYLTCKIEGTTPVSDLFSGDGLTARLMQLSLAPSSSIGLRSLSSQKHRKDKRKANQH